jgi:hypothetical protein
LHHYELQGKKSDTAWKKSFASSELQDEEIRNLLGNGLHGQSVFQELYFRIYERLVFR